MNPDSGHNPLLDGRPSFNPWIPQMAEVIGKRREALNVYTLRLRLRDEAVRSSFRFRSGQFNMLYVFGVGEVPISIVSDPDESGVLEHTIRRVGKASAALVGLKKGDTIGLRGPYGSSWPLEEAQGKDVVIVTG